MTFQAEAKRTAGLSGDEIPAAFQKLAKTLGEAGEGSKEAGKAFSDIGLSASTLKGQALDQTFEQIADKIRALPTVADQAAEATAIFGREGAKLLPLMNEGAAGIEKAHAEMLKIGSAVSDFDASHVAAAGETFDELGKRIEGAKNMLTVALAPTIMGIGNTILGLMPDADTLRDDFVDGLHGIAMGVGYVIDAYQVFKQGVLGLEEDAVAAFAKMLSAADNMVEGLIGAVNKISGTHIAMPEGLKDLAQTT